MTRQPPRSTLSSSSAASDVYKRQGINAEYGARTAQMARLMLRAGATSGAVMSIADTVAQALETSFFQHSPLDWQRTVRFGIVGVTLHGPYFQRGFAKVDSMFGASLNKAGQPLWGVVSKKVLVTQLALNPPFMVLLFGWMGLLEGRAWPGEVLDNIQAKWPSAFWAGNVFWPCANLVNFVFLRPQHRVAYVAGCGAMWNTYVSWLNNKQELCAPHPTAQP
eukprot:TRINITY_DN9175_c0_g1_i1.p1 TRINITY_DN9175_c0_g1~~TRINITY_DN9175_c0_g1_i1.p1  ORF type:complete len:221 (-),score=39.89 TRINITY_DN9175_c0_g1_i1:111-773(-)